LTYFATYSDCLHYQTRHHLLISLWPLVAIILNLAISGNMHKIQDWAVALEQQDKKLTPFAKKVNELAKQL